MAQKDVGEMKRAAGFQNEFWNRMTNEVIARKGSADQLYGANDQTLNAAAKAAVTVILGSSSSDGTVIRELELTVDHDRTVEGMVAAGNYNGYINPNIASANFPHPRKGVEKVTLKLVKFDSVRTTQQLEAALALHGDLPGAGMDDMLTTGIKHPNEQRKHPIVFLGAWWVRPLRGREIGCLVGGAEIRTCTLKRVSPADKWGPGNVFAVRAR